MPKLTFKQMFPELNDNQWSMLERLLAREVEVLEPKLYSMGNELYSGDFDAKSFRMGFEAAQHLTIVTIQRMINDSHG